ncbi:MAG: hypothetical protein HFH53_10340 [Hespellia sp.]|nr:hypothetical protein [Hespellia sp.]
MRKQRKILTRIAAVGMALLLIGQSFLVYAEEPLDGDTSLGGGVEEGIQNTENNPEVVDSVPGSDATQDSGDDMGSDDGQNVEDTPGGVVEEQPGSGTNATPDSDQLEEIPETDIQQTEDAILEPVYSLQYRAHCQSIGWQEWKIEGETAGTMGKGKRMEALAIKVIAKTIDPEHPEEVKEEQVAGAIEYQAHCQSIGWQGWKRDGEISGTVSEKKRLEAIQLRLTGELAEKYDIYYQVHCSRFGDMGWAKNGERAGTAGYARSIEAITIRLVEKGSADAPQQEGRSFLSPTEKGTLTYDSHVQSYGWMDAVADGEMSGTQGQAKRMEAFRMYLANPKDDAGQEIAGTVEYQAHSQSRGWMGWKQNGEIAGTTGQGKRLEALQIRLTGALAEQYDVYYRVHSAKWGTLGWAKNGEIAGTVGYYKSIESFEVKVVQKGSPDAPVQNMRSCLDIGKIGALNYSVSLKDEGWQSETGNNGIVGVTGQSKTIEALKMQIASGMAGNSADLYSGGIVYKAFMQSTGWQGVLSDGAVAGAPGQGKRLEAIQISLTGELEQYCDVYYRAHVQAYGWLGWAKNGQSAGTTDCAYRLEALQVSIVPKTAPAPGENTDFFKNEKKPSRKKIAEFTTTCTNTEASLYNMSRALSEFNGLVIQPGQTVSFFGVAGPCGAAQGYMPGGVVGGIGYGGGICQASTTLYGAALRAGMAIVERRNHSVPSTYVPIGQDAMVSWGTSDFKFRNDFSFPVTLVTYTDGRILHAEFWGQDPGWFDNVTVNSWYTGRNSAAAERIFYKSGREVRREALSNSYYR